LRIIIRGGVERKEAVISSLNVSVIPGFR
jgi:hypothetical protein